MNKVNLLNLLLPYQRNLFLNNKKRKIAICSRQVGKSHTLAHMLVYKALCKKNGLSLCISVNMMSAAEIIRKVAQVAQAVKILSNGEITYEKSFDKVVFSNGSRVISLSSNPSGARGYTAQLVAIDEAAYVEHFDEVIQAIAPTLTRDPDSELVITTTPAGKSGPFYELYSNALNNPDWYVQKTTIYDAINQGLKNVNIENLKSLCPDENIFNQEYLCEFNDSINSLIDTALLQTYKTKKLVDKDIFMGIDFGRTHDKTAISIINKDRQTNKIYLDEIITLTNKEFETQLTVIKQIFMQKEPKLVLVDAGGMGLPLAEDLNKYNARIQGFNFTNTSKNDCYENFRKLVFNNQLFIKQNYLNDIIQDISQIRQVISDSGKVIYSAIRTNSGHADIFSSLILALQAARDTNINSEMPMTYFRNSRF